MRFNDLVRYGTDGSAEEGHCPHPSGEVLLGLGGALGTRGRLLRANTAYAFQDIDGPVTSMSWTSLPL